MSHFCKLLWEHDKLGPMTESAIRLAHGGSNRNRISKYIYAPDDEIEGTCRECTGYVLRGAIRFSAGGCSESFNSGDVFRFSGGDYIARAAPPKGAELVWVWVLPEGFG